MITPSDYKDRYVNLKVYLDNGRSKTVSVHKYLMKSLGYHPEGDGAFKAALRTHGMDMVLRVDTGSGINLVDRKLNDRELKMRNKSHLDLSLSEERSDGSVVISTQADKAITDATGKKKIGEKFTERDWFSMAHYCFLGKGSPEACQVVLQLAHHWGLTDEAHLQDYVDKWLGVDCNGFVGNYLFHVVQENPWTDIGVQYWDYGPDVTIDGYFDHRKPYLTAWEQMVAGKSYLMGKVKDGVIVQGGGGADTAGHIVITQPNDRAGRPGGKFAIRCIESTFGHTREGFVDNYYTFKSVSGKVFTVDRGPGMKPGHKEMDVVIAAV
ncbi:MAG TPA: hypothetical protein VKU19_17800 [Bryobacteraceae bacterium]|nr:hypothetical protein [Bryobacteraceae bacterium]